jgi:hypothetical protein
MVGRPPAVWVRWLRRKQVPGVQFNDQGKRLQSQFELKVVVLLRAALGLAHVPIHLLALLLGSPALLAGLPRQGRR